MIFISFSSQAKCFRPFNVLLCHFYFQHNTRLLEHQCDGVKLLIHFHIQKSLLSGFCLAAHLTWKCTYVMFWQINQSTGYWPRCFEQSAKVFRVQGKTAKCDCHLLVYLFEDDSHSHITM